MTDKRIPADHKKLAKAFRENYVGLPEEISEDELVVGINGLLAELDWLEKNPPDFTNKDHGEMRHSLKIRDKIIWCSALAFVRSWLEEPKKEK